MLTSWNAPTNERRKHTYTHKLYMHCITTPRTTASRWQPKHWRVTHCVHGPRRRTVTFLVTFHSLIYLANIVFYWVKKINSNDASDENTHPNTRPSQQQASQTEKLTYERTLCVIRYSMQAMQWDSVAYRRAKKKNNIWLAMFFRSFNACEICIPAKSINVRRLLVVLELMYVYVEKFLCMCVYGYETNECTKYVCTRQKKIVYIQTPATTAVCMHQITFYMAQFWTQYSKCKITCAKECVVRHYDLFFIQE